MKVLNTAQSACSASADSPNARSVINRAMHRLLHLSACLLVCVSVSISPALHAQQLLPEILPFEIEYDVGNNLISAGSAKLSLTRKGDEWIYSLTTKPSGIFKLTGKGKIQEIAVMDVTRDKSLQPKRYTYRQDQEDKRSVDAWFDWDDNQLRYKKSGEETVEKINDPILDRLSVTLAIMEQLRVGFETAELQVFDSGRIKTVVFENEGTMQMKTKLGKVDVIRIRSYNSSSGRKRETVTWFAPEYDYIPVQFEQHKRGKLVARLTLSKYKTQESDPESGPENDPENSEDK